VVISAQTPRLGSRVRATHGLECPVLVDHDNRYARSLGLVFSIPSDLRDVYTSFGVKLPAFHGVDGWELPLPTRIVVGRDGVIRSVEANVDFTRRPEAEASVEVVRSLAS